MSMCRCATGVVLLSHVSPITGLLEVRLTVGAICIHDTLDYFYHLDPFYSTVERSHRYIHSLFMQTPVVGARFESGTLICQYQNITAILLFLVHPHSLNRI